VIGINIISSHNRVVDIVAVVNVDVYITRIDFIPTSTYTLVVAIPCIIVILVVNVPAVIVFVDICSVVITRVAEIPVIIARIIANVSVR